MLLGTGSCTSLPEGCILRGNVKLFWEECRVRFKREGPVAVVDLHGVYEREARMLLEGWLNQAPEEVQELRVIHGYQRGTVLRDMVREEFVHPRVAAVLPSLNPGETRLLLRNPGKGKRTGPQTHGKKRGR